MRWISVILLLAVSLLVRGTNYYVKTGGSDVAAGTSDGAAWATITRVNTAWAAGTFNAGDSILFNRGDSFSGTITVTESGSSGSPIVIGAYGTGDDPIITGFASLSTWADYSGNIKSQVVSTQSAPQILLKNGVNVPMGRWPKSSYAIVDTGGSTSLVDGELPSSPDYDGATVVMRTTSWVIEKRTATHTSQTISFSALTYPAQAGYGYFVQNHLSVLTQADDWAYLSGSLYYYSPGAATITIPSLDRLIVCNGYDYITVTDIALEGANTEAIYMEDCDNVDVLDVSISNCGGYGIRGVTTATNVTVTGCDFDEINNTAIRLTGSSHTVTSNTLNKIGSFPGMGYITTGDLDHALVGIEVLGDAGGHIISYNVIDSTGYDGISFGGDGTEVSYNVVSNHCFVKDDGGGIYSYNDYNSGKVVKYNFCYNGIGAVEGSTHEFGAAHGIYNDGSHNILYEKNVCWNNPYGGFFTNPGVGVILRDNLLYDNRSQFLIVADASVDDNVATNNIFFAKNRYTTYDQTSLNYILRGTFEWSTWGTMTANYHVRPMNNDDYIETWYDAWEWQYNNRQVRNLAEWQSLSGLDAGSFTTPVTITDENDIHFIYNVTDVNKRYDLSATMTDARNTTYSGSVTIAPFTAMVLIGDGTIVEAGEAPPPAIGTVLGTGTGNNLMVDKNGRIIIIQ